MNALTTTSRAGSASLAPQTFQEAVTFSQMLARSGMVPKDYNGKPEAIMVAIQWGAEVGLGPLQAVQNIAVINGRPSLWGDAALALVRGHPACAGIREGVEGEGDAMLGFCEVTRRGEQPQRRTFSVAEAKKAGLWGKPGPWQNYPARMLQLRARGFAIRDIFPDALRGVITAEEAQDMPTEAPRDVPNLAAEPPAPAPRDTLPILAPSGAVHQVPPGRWLAAVTRALAGLESAEAVREWRKAMGPHVAGVYERDEAMAMEADTLIQARLDQLDPPEPGAVEPDEVEA
jgi:hypothetical protein